MSVQGWSPKATSEPNERVLIRPKSLEVTAGCSSPKLSSQVWVSLSLESLIYRVPSPPSLVSKFSGFRKEPESAAAVWVEGRGVFPGSRQSSGPLYSSTWWWGTTQSSPRWVCEEKQRWFREREGARVRERERETALSSCRMERTLRCSRGATLTPAVGPEIEGESSESRSNCRSSTSDGWAAGCAHKWRVTRVILPRFAGGKSDVSLNNFHGNRLDKKQAGGKDGCNVENKRQGNL